MNEFIQLKLRLGQIKQTELRGGACLWPEQFKISGAFHFHFHVKLKVVN